MAEQFDLFAGAPLASAGLSVEGLALITEAVSPQEEDELAAWIDAAPLEPFRFGQWTGRRLTCAYGSGYDFTRGRLAEAPPLPDWLLELRNRLGPLAGIEPAALGQALLIRYDPGAGIGWHRDRPHYGEVLGLSLSAECTLRLRRRTEEGFERESLHLPRRALYRLAGEARWEWEHSIAPLAETRRSITLRTLG
jgi:alkylated DNA repair dioxygenase AlkB